MTARRPSFSVAKLRRVMRAAKEEECAVELRPDGSVVVLGRLADVPAAEQTARPNSWADKWQKSE